MVCSLSPVCGDRVDVVDYSVGKEKLKSIVGLLFPTLSQCFAALSPESDDFGDGDREIVDDFDASVDNVNLFKILTSLEASAALDTFRDRSSLV